MVAVTEGNANVVLFREHHVGDGNEDGGEEDGGDDELPLEDTLYLITLL